MEVAEIIEENLAMLAWTQGSLTRRVQLHIENNGGHFEQLCRISGQKSYNQLTAMKFFASSYCLRMSLLIDINTLNYNKFKLH